MWAVRLRVKQRRWHGYARVGGDGGAGFWVCAADFAAEPGICGGGGADFGAGDWREYGDLYFVGSGVATAAASEESAAVGVADHAWEALWEQLGRQRDFLSDVPRFSESQRSFFRDVLPVPATGEHDVWGASGAHAGRISLGNILRCIGHRNGVGARD